MHYKHLIVLLAGVLLLNSNLLAQEEETSPVSISTELLSHYNVRGIQYDKLSFQPDFRFEKLGFCADAWFSISTPDWKFKTFNYEMDLTLSYTFKGFQIGLVDYYYFAGHPFAFNQEEDTPQLEAFLQYQISEALPLRFLWASYIIGGDTYESIINETINEQRAYSTYIEIGYEHYWERPNLSLDAAIGITPWISQYSGYEGSAGICNLSALLTKSFDTRLPFYIVAHGMYNPMMKTWMGSVGIGIEFL